MAQPTSFDISPEKEASKLQFLRRQFAEPPSVVTKKDADLDGKTAIVTGGNSGIGLECARQLLDLGLGRLILAVRDETKGETACQDLLKAKNLKSTQKIEVWKLDYASYDSIMAFTRRAETLDPPLDIAILNAGINRNKFSLNPTTGHEEDLQTNYLSTVLLVFLILGVYKSGKPTASSFENATPERIPGRIVIVSSDTAAWANFAEKDKCPLLPAFNQKAAFDKIDRYATTKLLGQLFIVELAKRVPAAFAIVNCANPGLCYGSMLNRELGLPTAIFTRTVGRPAAIGARVLVHAAVKQDANSHGQYIEDGKVRPYVCPPNPAHN